MYKISIIKSFAKRFKKLEKKERERIKKKLRQTANAPELYFEKLTNYNLFRLRIGKYRLIAQINFKEKRITPISVNLRKKSYQKL